MTTSPDYHFVTSHQINQFNMLTEIRVGSRFVSNQKIKGKVGSLFYILTNLSQIPLHRFGVFVFDDILQDIQFLLYP